MDLPKKRHKNADGLSRRPEDDKLESNDNKNKVPKTRVIDKVERERSSSR